MRKALKLVAFSLVLLVPRVKAPAQITLLQEIDGKLTACSISGLRGFGDSCGAEHDDQVFIGQVLLVERISNWEFRLTVRPEEVFRGVPETIVTTTTTQGICLPKMRTGDRWLFALRRDENSKELMLDYGGSSGPINEESVMISRLRSLMSMNGAGMVRGEVSGSALVHHSQSDFVPRPNHKVILRPTEDGSGSERVVFTDKDGLFDFESVPEGTYHLIANSEPGVWSGDGGKTEVKSNECRDYHIDLQPDGTIAGKVTVDGAASSQTWNIDAVSVDDLNVGKASGFTDDDGNFELHGLGPGRYLIGIEIVGISNFYYLKSAVYSPGVTEPSRALTIELGKGERREGMDIRIPSAELCPEHCSSRTSAPAK